MSYSKTSWQNLPSTSTPVNATNLNKIENNLANSVNAINIDEYNPSSIYHTGDYCYKDNLMYVNVYGSSTTGAWNPSRWTQISISQLLTGFSQKLNTTILSASDVDDYFTNIDINKIYVSAGWVSFTFRAYVNKNIPSNTNYLEGLPEPKLGSSCEIVVYTGNHYEVSTPVWAFVTSDGIIKGKPINAGTYVHINVVYKKA